MGDGAISSTKRPSPTTKNCPGRVLSELVQKILSNGGSNSDRIFLVYTNGIKVIINPLEINRTVKLSVRALGL